MRIWWVLSTLALIAASFADGETLQVGLSSSDYRRKNVRYQKNEESKLNQFAKSSVTHMAA